MLTYITNQIISDELLVARIEGGMNEACYMHNVKNGAKVYATPNQMIRIGEGYIQLVDVLDDYVLVQGDQEFPHDDNEFTVNEDVFKQGDLIVTRIDREKGICYTHSLATGAKISFYLGQRIQVGEAIYRLLELTDDFAQFELI